MAGDWECSTGVPMSPSMAVVPEMCKASSSLSAIGRAIYAYFSSRDLNAAFWSKKRFICPITFP